MERYSFSKEQLDVIEHMQVPCAIYQFINKRVVTLALSDGFCEVFGYDDKAQAYHDMDNDMYKFTHPDDVARIANEAIRFATEGGKYEVIYRTLIMNSTKYKVIHAVGKHIYMENGARLSHVAYTDEGTYSEDARLSESELNKALNDALHTESLLNVNRYDYLTGLPRMTYFLELAEAGKDAVESEGRQCAMLFLDMCGMKFYNSKFGFAEGDKLLKAVSRILVNKFSTENCCHMGGDHFAVYTQANGLEQKLKELIDEFTSLNGGRSLHVRIGVYVNGVPNGVAASTAIDMAKYACDEIRSSYGSGYNYFKTDMLDKAYLRQYVVSHLDRALEEKWIQVYYQPIVRAVNSHVCDEEALARWIDPVKGFLSPADFIPYLESAGLLYKLDLYVLERVIEKLVQMKEIGYPVLPHSVNLSRSDFDRCDIVEEIRRRVDDAGISRKLITIEITESMIGSNFEYMKEQIARFRELGFQVWMDDFGSGYSSLDVLLEIPFDLIKFDMSFMRRLDEGAEGKILLTELMRMATALGLDTLCEGVETETQVRFLREIGCSKLQGYYFHRPVPLHDLLTIFKSSSAMGYENHEEVEYYESIGRVNLYDLSFIAAENENMFQNIFNTIPMGILELDSEGVRYVRCNQAYRDFMARYFGFDVSDPNHLFPIKEEGPGSGFMRMILGCDKTDSKALYNEKLPDGTVIHSFARKISENPITGRTAAAVAVLSITEKADGTTYADIARALASDYYNIYYVDLDTEHFIEYSSQTGSEEIAEERHGENFFESSRNATMVRIYEDDREMFLKGFTKENVTATLDKQGVYTATYRLVDSGKPMYASMKCTRMPGSNHIIIGISIVDAQMKQKEQYEQLQKERDAMVRVMALSEGYLSLFTIDPVSGGYTEYSSSDTFDSLGVAKAGDDFFRQAIIDSEKFFHPDDVPVFAKTFTKNNIMSDIREKGSFKAHYRLMINGSPHPVTLMIAPFRDRDGEKLVAGVRAWKERRSSK